MYTEYQLWKTTRSGNRVAKVDSFQTRADAERFAKTLGLKYYDIEKKYLIPSLPSKTQTLEYRVDHLEAEVAALKAEKTEEERKKEVLEYLEIYRLGNGTKEAVYNRLKELFSK